jgi:hypothetical protein
MAALDLLQLFESLVMPMPVVHGNDLVAVPIPDAITHRLAKDANGSPCLLIRQPPQYVRAAPIRLQNLLVSFDVPCSIRAPGGKLEKDTFTILCCSPTNPRLFPHFLKIVTPIVAGLGPLPTTAEVRRVISGLVAVFQALTVPAKKTVQGLWAEILLIRLSSDPCALAAAWHRDPLEHFDFSAGRQRVEVKSSNCRRREHHFSLEQLTSVMDSRIAIASVFVERVGGGLPLRKLVDDVRTLLSGDVTLMTQFDAVVYKSLGSDWSDAMDECFDWELAVDSISFFDSGSVPRPENPTPHSVFDIRFRSDLGSIRRLDPLYLLEQGGLFAAASPR